MRLISQFVTEALVLVLAGVTLGLVASHWMMQLLTGQRPEVKRLTAEFIERKSTAPPKAAPPAAAPKSHE